MATQDGEDVQQAEKVGLKRKLTGPPRLLLGKTRTRSVGEERPEARTNKHKMEYSGGDESSLKYWAEPTETANMDGVNVESTRGRCEAAEEVDDVTSRKGNRRRWWRRFSPVVVCNRKQKRDVNKGSAQQQRGVPDPPEGVLQDTEGKRRFNVMKRRFNVRTWPTFKRSLTSSGAQQTHEQRRDNDDDEGSLTFRKKMHLFFTRGGKNRWSGNALENMEGVMKSEEPPCSSVSQDERTDVNGHVTVRNPEVVTVTVEERAADSPDETQGSVTEEAVSDAGGSETIQIDSNKVPDPPEVRGDQVSTTSQSVQPSTNGPSIRIELVPPDDNDEEEEECSSSENQNHHLLLLIGFDHSEQQLVQTARSLVRAAMNAAMDQLTREQLSGAECVHREPPGCRDHA